MFMFGVTWYFWTITTYGINVPSGLFLPGMIVGTALGDLYVHTLLDWGWVDAAHLASFRATYLSLAMAAMLAGYTRMTYSIIVITMETCQSVSIFVPLVLAVGTANVVGDCFTRSLYERAVRGKQMPILVKHVPHYHKFLRASEIMNPHVVSLKAVDSVENIQTAITTNNHHGFPIVNNAERAVGYISKNYLVILLRERRFYDKQEVELANSQAVLHNHDEDLDDPYACSDMLDLSELPISKVPELDWTYFKRSYTS
jgi:chloride channel 7